MIVLGAVLAGGRSSRFGSDKALALLQGRPLIEHVVDALTAHVNAIAICGRAFGAHVALTDRPPGVGPLGAMSAALDHAARQGYEAVLTVPCDVPILSDDMLRALGRTTATFLDVCPVIGLWPASVGPLLDDYLLSSRDRSVRGFAQYIGATAIGGSWDIVNVNTSDDLALLELGYG